MRKKIIPCISSPSWQYVNLYLLHKHEFRFFLFHLSSCRLLLGSLRKPPILAIHCTTNNDMLKPIIISGFPLLNAIMEQFVQHDSSAGLKHRPHGHVSYANGMCTVILSDSLHLLYGFEKEPACVEWWRLSLLFTRGRLSSSYHEWMDLFP